MVVVVVVEVVGKTKSILVMLGIMAAYAGQFRESIYPPILPFHL